MASGTRLYVGNLSYSTSEETLRGAFEQNGGQVAEIKIITDRETGQPRGYAFIEMSTPAQAQAARKALDGSGLDGRTIKVSEARERANDGGDRGGWNRGGRY